MFRVDVSMPNRCESDNRYWPTVPHILSGLPQVEIEISRGVARHRMRAVAGPVFLIGAAADCDLVLGDEQFPEVHTYLFLTADKVVLRWLGAGPECTVNGVPARSTALADGDRLRMGSYEFQMHIRGPGKPTDDRPTTGRRSDTPSALAGTSKGLASVRSLLGDVRGWLHPAAPPPRRTA